jgi:hypothetical protein
MQLVGTGTAAAIRDQQVSVAAGDLGKEHALSIIIERGPVTLRVGSSLGNDDYIRETALGTGAHSLAFTPSGNFHIRFLSRLERIVLVDSITVEGAGAMAIRAPWPTADLRRVRAAQSGDVLFVAAKGYQQRRIERRAARSWSVVLYQTEDGPFRTENLGPITITPSGLTGNVTLTASAALFKSTQVGALWRTTSEGQRVTASINAANSFTNEIRVTGVGESRRFTITRSGVWSATVTLQRSIGEPGLWEDVEDYTTNDTVTYADELDNQIVFYRLGIKTGDYTSGLADLTLSYPLGSITGVARITGFTSSTVVDAEVLSDLGGTDATELWAEGLWSDFRGWPSAVELYEGRLWWAGKNAIVASISDAFDGFDPDFEGDAGTINRTIGSGPVDDINWMQESKRLLIGAEGAEMAIRSSALDEPLTPTNFNIKPVSGQGSAEVPAAKIDTRVVFVQRSGLRVYQLAYTAEAADYEPEDLTALVPEIGSPGIVAIAIQRQPDTRLHCLRSDGTVALAVIDRAENVLSWQEIETDGEVEDIVVLPGIAEDAVYYVVKRSLGASGVVSLTVTAAGTGYTSAPRIVFTGGGGSNAAGSTLLGMVSFTIQAAGASYAVNDIVELVGGEIEAPFTAAILITQVDGAGGVLAASILSEGGYHVAPVNPVETTALLGGLGIGFTVNVAWGLIVATVTNNGGGYESAPAITLVGDGVGATVTATIASSTLSGHYLEKWAQESECRGGTLNKQADSFIVSTGATTVLAGGFVSSLSALSGAGYSAVPALTFSGGGGSGATATVGLRVVDQFLGNIGSGYSRGDLLTLVGGTFTRPAKFQVLSTFGAGQILPNSVILVDAGEYSVIPDYYRTGGGAVPVTGGTGSGALIVPIWGLSQPVITNPGSGYTSAPAVTVSSVTLSFGASDGSPGLSGTVSSAVTALTNVTATSGEIIGGLNHLEGREVVVWADGRDLSPDDEDDVQRTYTVTGGQITLDAPVSSAVVGLPYEARWKSTKLAYVAEEGMTALCQKKRVMQLGLILANTHNKGIKFGPTFDVMDELPQEENDALVSTEDGTFVWDHYDKETIEFPGDYDTDSRVCLKAQAPRPCTVLAAVMAIEGSPK